MMKNIPFPALGDWAETRQTLHAYAKVLGTIRGAFSPEQAHYWHLSLLPYTAGLTTSPIPHPADKRRNFSLSMDLRNHYILLTNSEGGVEQMRMAEGLSATQLGERLLGKLAEMGVEGEVNRHKYADESPRSYALDDAERYFTALTHVARLFEKMKAELKGESSPVQLWPHHFDLSLVRFGTKTVKTEEGEYPSQVGFGFSPPDDSQAQDYFYVNPFPYEDKVSEAPLTPAATWYSASWKGALLPYAAVADKEDGTQILESFLRAAWEAEKGFI
jgi:hypothetical protein